MTNDTKIISMRITFKENCDVWYEVRLACDYKQEKSRYIIDYPVSKIEIDDNDSILPIYKSEIPNNTTLLEIKGMTSEITIKYVKKEFLKKEIINGNKNVLKYRENILVDIDKNQNVFCLHIHSPYSYVSAIRDLSTAKFNGISYAPGDLCPIYLKQSGTMEIDWTLEIVDIAKETNVDKRRQYLDDYTQKHQIIKKINWYNYNGRPYKWLDEINEMYFNLTDKNFRNRVKEIIYGSCFYLSAGADITPIIALQDKIRTFIFCDNYRSYTNTNYGIEKYWSKIDNKLKEQSFNKAISFNEKFHRIRNLYYLNWEFAEFSKYYISFWEKNKKLYCLIYFNCDNSLAFNNLYVKNRIIPKAMCELLPDGGSLYYIPYKFRMPEYAIGHKCSLGNPEEYQLITDTIKYFGDYPDTYGNAGSINGIKLYKRR